MFSTIYSVAGLVACCLILALAIWKGAATEQAAAGATALAWASVLGAQLVMHAYARAVLAIDIALLLFFGVLVWRSSKDWPLATLAFQGVIAAADAWYLFDRTIPYTVYVVATAASTAGVLASIGYGVWQTASRKSPSP